MRNTESILIWYPTILEPEPVSVILFSSKNNKIYEGTYMSSGKFEVNGLLVDKAQFGCYAYRSEFMEVTGLIDYLE